MQQRYNYKRRERTWPLTHAYARARARTRRVHGPHSAQPLAATCTDMYMGTACACTIVPHMALGTRGRAGRSMSGSPLEAGQAEATWRRQKVVSRIDDAHLGDTCCA